jgi:uncharacterized protein YozE (UPF0346 family)
MRFYTWLREQRKRDDPIGDLARDAMADKNFPQALNRVRSHLLNAGACSEALVAFNEARKEFQNLQ